ncbi:hypothetical protein [Endozoicomonas sp. Mp262]|uniref:hypothetical protein n=1 Tax=Endozoicomonas sp. Mp262 TaxID=2919499 RepID=UPI0021D9BB15
MSLENRVEKLEADVINLHHLILKKEEVKHQVWNDMQEEVHRLCKETAQRVERLEQGQLALEKNQQDLKTEFNDFRQAITGELGSLKSEVGTLKSEVGTLRSEVGTLKSMLSEVLQYVKPVC